MSLEANLEGYNYMPSTTKIEFVSLDCSLDQLTLNAHSASGLQMSFAVGLSHPLPGVCSLPPLSLLFFFFFFFFLRFPLITVDWVAPARYCLLFAILLRRWRHTVSILSRTPLTDRNLYFVHVCRPILTKYATPAKGASACPLGAGSVGGAVA
ncbi:hypothetical protein BO71DRAFT_33229 [Aspergillus ellipticus CBS 707.79]|uniref:Uncharacterized protein n=1 Tax=Aspergillus ellipticus CBS 707.79 TaxID=1448320 RepID=A0A319DQ07_9EURO|nr:hypothetical protein BO71DRAFT_33229 [Aspergillus ellipticus CBS 707.79]